MAFYQKYRAKNFKEMVGQEHVIGTLLASIQSDRLVHAILLAGPRGIGKTSVARLLAKAINCEKVIEARNKGEKIAEPCNSCPSCQEINEGRSIDVVEIDAASHTGVEEIRDVIEKARLSPTRLLKKVYIIDEVHMLSKSAFNALLKTLEEPPSHVVFILATTEAHKIPATILSRVQRYDFRRADKADLIKNLRRVADTEKMAVTDEVLELIAILSAGGHRDALGLLEQLSTTKDQITLDIAREVLGVSSKAEIEDFIGAIFNENPEEGLKIARQVYDHGLDMLEFNRGVIDLLRKILLVSISIDMVDDETTDKVAKLKTMSAQVNHDEILRLLNNFIEAGVLLKDISYPLLPIEMAVIKSVGSKKPIAGSQGPGVKNLEQKKEARNNESGISNLEYRTENKQASSFQIPVSNPQDTVPVPVLEMTKDIWVRIIEETKKENSTLAALLRDAKPEEVTGSRLTLGVKFKFHKDKISEAKNMSILEKVVCDITGSPYKVSCKLFDDKPKNKAADSSGIEKAVGEVFET